MSADPPAATTPPTPPVMVIPPSDAGVRIALYSTIGSIVVAALTVFGSIVIARLDEIHTLTNNNYAIQVEATKESNRRLDDALARIDALQDLIAGKALDEAPEVIAP